MNVGRMPNCGALASCSIAMFKPFASKAPSAEPPSDQAKGERAGNSTCFACLYGAQKPTMPEKKLQRTPVLHSPARNEATLLLIFPAVFYRPII
jgi:hypothetical protein